MVYSDYNDEGGDACGDDSSNYAGDGHSMNDDTDDDSTLLILSLSLGRLVKAQSALTTHCCNRSEA